MIERMRNHLISLCLCAVILGGCASGMQPSTDYMDPDGTTISVAGTGPMRNPNIVRALYSEQFSNVLLVNREAGSQPNAHPVQIGTDTLASMLAEVNMRKSAGAKPEPLFSDDDVKVLSAWLANGLAAATPDQEVVFSYAQAQGMGLFTLKYLTTGRVFYRDGHLNIIFGVVEAVYEAEYLAEGRFRPRPVGSRFMSTMQNELDRQLVTDNQVLPGAPGRTDWLVLSVPTGAHAPAPGQIQTPPPAQSTTLFQDLFQSKTPAPAPVQAAAPAPAPTPAATPAATPASIEDRLSALKKLHDSGLITDQEFNDKRKQILDGL